MPRPSLAAAVAATVACRLLAGCSDGTPTTDPASSAVPSVSDVPTAFGEDGRLMTVPRSLRPSSG